MHANSGDGHSSSKSTQSIIMINICCTDGIITSIEASMRHFLQKKAYRHLGSFSVESRARMVALALRQVIALR